MATRNWIKIVDEKGPQAAGDKGAFINVLTVDVGTLAEVAANTSAEQDITVAGLDASDVIVGVSKPTAQAGIGIVGARVKAANTLSITFMNTTAAGVTPTADEDYLVTVIRINN